MSRERRSIPEQIENGLALAGLISCLLTMSWVALRAWRVL